MIHMFFKLLSPGRRPSGWRLSTGRPGGGRGVRRILFALFCSFLALTILPGALPDLNLVEAGAKPRGKKARSSKRRYKKRRYRKRSRRRAHYRRVKLNKRVVKDPIARALQTPDPRERQDLIYTYSRRGGKIVPRVIKIFRQDGLGRQAKPAAARILIRVGRPALTPILNSFRDKNSEVRYWGLYCLGKIRPLTRRSLNGVIPLLNDPRARIRARAAATLAEMGMPSREAGLALLPLLTDKSHNVRTQGIRAVARVVTPRGELRERLEKILGERGANTELERAWAAIALSGLKDKNQNTRTPHLLKGLKYKRYQTNTWAAAALVSADSRQLNRVAPHLISALSLKDAASAKGRARAILLVKSRQSVPLLVDALKDADPRGATAIARLLGVLGEPAFIRLRAGLGSSDWYTRWVNLQALRYQQKWIPRLKDDFLRLLNDPEPSIARTASDLLASRHIRALESMMAIIQNQANPPAKIEAALLTLGRMKKNAAPAIDLIRPYLGYKNGKLRTAAAGALVGIGAPAVAPILKGIKALIGPMKNIPGASRKLELYLDIMVRIGRPALPSLRRLLQKRSCALALELPPALTELKEAPESLVSEILRSIRLNHNCFRAYPDYGEFFSNLGAPAIPYLIRELGNSASGDQAANGLAALGGVALPALLKALKDHRSGVRLRAAEAIYLMGDQADWAVAHIERGLKDRAPEVRAMVARILGGLGERGRLAIPALNRSARTDPHIRVRHSAAAALARLSGRRQGNLAALVSGGVRGPSLSSSLSSAYAAEGEREDLQEGFYEVGDNLTNRSGGRLVLPYLIQLGNDRDRYARSWALRQLGELSNAAALSARPHLLRSLRRAEVEEAALGALVEQGVRSNSVLGALERRIKKRPGAGSIRILRRLGVRDRRFLSPLLGALAHKDPYVRKEALRALGHFGYEATPHRGRIKAALKDNDPLVVIEAALALHRVSPGEDRVGLDALIAILTRKGLRGHFYKSALLAIGEYDARGRPAAGTLRSVLVENEDPDIRLLCALALGKIGGESPARLLPFYIDALAEKEYRRFAIELFVSQKKNAPAAIEALEGLLYDPDPEIRAAALRAFARMAAAARPALRSIRRARNDGNALVEFCAREALGKVGGAAEE